MAEEQHGAGFRSKRSDKKNQQQKNTHTKPNPNTKKKINNNNNKNNPSKTTRCERDKKVYIFLMKSATKQRPEVCFI